MVEIEGRRANNIDIMVEPKLHVVPHNWQKKSVISRVNVTISGLKLSNFLSEEKSKVSRLNYM